MHSSATHHNVVAGAEDNPIFPVIIFNTIQNELVPTEACAFIRHAFNHFYRDFAMVDTHDKTFVWQSTLNRTMQGFRNAVLAYGESIKSFRTHIARTPHKRTKYQMKHSQSSANL